MRPTIMDPLLVVKVAVAPLLMAGATLAGRRWGHRVGGWLVALPLTSGPAAYFLAVDLGVESASRAATGMLAGTISQVAFALAYAFAVRPRGSPDGLTADDARPDASLPHREGTNTVAERLRRRSLHAAVPWERGANPPAPRGSDPRTGHSASNRGAVGRGWVAGMVAGSGGFAVATAVLSVVDWAPLPTFALVGAAVALGIAAMRRIARPGAESFEAVTPPRWDVPLRMMVATAIVVGIGAIAPVIGPRQAGLLSPFPVFGSILAVLTHRVYGPGAATALLGGLVAGLASPAVFFVTLAATLPWFGLMAFVPATACALATQAATR